MGLFGRKSGGGRRCSDCKSYVMVEGYGYCAKMVPASVNVRLLSAAGLRRQCVRCPEAMTCEDWQAK